MERRRVRTFREQRILGKDVENQNASEEYQMESSDVPLSTDSDTSLSDYDDVVKPFQKFDDLERGRMRIDSPTTPRDPSGLLTNDLKALVVTGDDLTEFTKDHWKLALQYKEMVFARTSPKQKLEIVQAHQDLGLVVGVTGDGVNDAPAMNQADIGIAMGSGSEVSKETANLVLADDNFANVVVGISLGRLAFENLKKVLLYLLPAGTFCEMLTVLANVRYPFFSYVF